MRITVDIDPGVLAEAKALAKQRGKTLGETVSVLLAQALKDAQAPKGRPPFRWSSQPMEQLVDLEDKEVVWRILDAEEREPEEFRLHIKDLGTVVDLEDKEAVERILDAEQEQPSRRFEWYSRDMGIRSTLRTTMRSSARWMPTRESLGVDI
jgi:macrodomain Ter protein organizer (MatP/YcbG family)